MNPQIFTVSEVSNLIQRTLNQNFSNILVKGEISGVKKHTSGHVYFDLKDAGGAVINAICWRGTSAKLKTPIENGLEVIAGGQITTYPQRSNYQIIINSLEVEGLGALMALLEERKKKLLAEGLFDPARKKSFPFIPKAIGIITSPTGAVIKDILHRLSDRFGLQVYLYPAKVQGDGAAAEVTNGIEFFNNIISNDKIIKPDVLIVARGGGSIEDLWAFNEEILVRAVANSKIPIISAVGHETDTTLIDYAADKRAPTPTAAAEMAVPVKAELISAIMNLKSRAFNAVNMNIEAKARVLKSVAMGLISPKQVLENYTQKLDDLNERLANSINRILKEKSEKLKNIRFSPDLILKFLEQKNKEISNYKNLLESYSYKNVLNRGYSVIREKGSRVITSVSQLQAGKIIEIELKDGTKQAEILGKAKKLELQESLQF
jgi:exodeoxyribonuclease VII large subunit